MGTWDDLGKELMRGVAGSDYSEADSSIEFGASGGRAKIDGTVAGMIAVEIESREPKQIDGAILHLMCHKFPKKLLVLLPVHNKRVTVNVEERCLSILARFLPRSSFEVIQLDLPFTSESVNNVRASNIEKIKRALGYLGWQTTQPAAS